MHPSTRFPRVHLKPCQTLRRAICALVSLHSLQAIAAADVVPVAGGATVSAQQGMPVVNIVAPNAAGLSHNQFLNYDVERQGLVLNNSTVPG
ncbi:hypothetical protein [Pseudomonas yamanorum]